MSEETYSKSLVRISLIDVMYGVVLAYGFNFFDQANTCISYIRFFSAYVIIIIDWIYVHPLYWSLEDEYNSFLILLDIGILFTISRLFHASTSCPTNYWLWMSGLFLLYAIWDIAMYILSMRRKLPSKHDWCYSICGDFFAAIILFVFHVLFIKGIFPYICSLNVIRILACTVAVLTWFIKPKRSVA